MVYGCRYIIYKQREWTLQVMYLLHIPLKVNLNTVKLWMQKYLNYLELAKNRNIIRYCLIYLNIFRIRCLNKNLTRIYFSVYRSSSWSRMGGVGTVLLVLLFILDVFTDIACGVELILNDHPECKFQELLLKFNLK